MFQKLHIKSRLVTFADKAKNRHPDDRLQRYLPIAETERMQLTVGKRETMQVLHVDRIRSNVGSDTC